MGLAKVIGIIFLILFLILAVVGVDAYLTYKSLEDVDPESLVSDPQFETINNNQTVKVTVQVELPDGGFIPKGIIIELILDFGDTQVSDKADLNMGDNKNISLEFTLTEDQKTTLQSGGSITADLLANITPKVLGFEIGFATQEVDLASHTISGSSIN